MGENNYTIVQRPRKRKALTFDKVPYYLWKLKTREFNALQTIIVAALISIFAFGFIALIYLFFTEGL
jgi:hypothetical protein